MGENKLSSKFTPSRLRTQLLLECDSQRIVLQFEPSICIELLTELTFEHT